MWQDKNNYFKICVASVFVIFLMTNAISQEEEPRKIYIETIEDLQKIGNDPNYPLDADVVYVQTGNIDAVATISTTCNEGKGTAEGMSEGQSECVITGDIFLTQELSGDGVYIEGTTIYYSPGKPITVKVTLTKYASEQILALGLKSLFPSGWQFQGISSGNAPSVYPVSDKVTSNGKDPFEFAWITVPSFPFSFSFTVNVPSNMEGACQTTTQALFRMSGPQYCSNIVQTSFAGSIPPQEGEGTQEGPSEGTVEGITEGTQEGTPEGSSDGEGTASMTIEELRNVLKTRFVELDINGDSMISWEEASSAYPNLGRDVFNQLDTDGDGKITPTEAGIKEKPKGICGLLTRIFSGEKMWQKSLLDLLLVGILMSILSGIKKK